MRSILFQRDCVNERAGTISAQGELQLDEPLPQNQPGRVQIIVLFPESVESEEITPAQWNQAVASNPSFAFLHDEEEDIYTLEDGIAVGFAGNLER
jgi:hypothetical protein